MTAAAQTNVVHDTITMERTYNASPARVFQAWESVEARLRWMMAGAVYDQAEFKAGGLDIMRFGAGEDDMRFLAHIRYLEILRDRRIVMAESLAEDGKNRIVSLVTIELEPVGQTTKQTVTMQAASFDGPDMLAGYSDWTAVLDNLAKEVEG